MVQGHLVKWPDNSHAQLPGLTHTQIMIEMNLSLSLSLSLIDKKKLENVQKSLCQYIV